MNITIDENIEIIISQLTAVLDTFESIRVEAEQNTSNQMVVSNLALEALIDKLKQIIQ